MVVFMFVFAFAPRVPVSFVSLELLFRALSNGCGAALLGIALTAIGKGAASTKAASLWSLANFSNFYPALIEGAVHDRGGTAAMLLTDTGLGAVGFCVLVVALRLFRSVAKLETGSIPASLFGK